MALAFSLDLTKLAELTVVPGQIGCPFCIAGTFNFETQLVSEPNGSLVRTLGFQGVQSLTTNDASSIPSSPGSNVPGTLQYASNGSVPFAPNITLVSSSTFPLPVDGTLNLSVKFADPSTEVTDPLANTYVLIVNETRIGRQPGEMLLHAFHFHGAVPTNSVPEPSSTLLLFGLGLLGLTGYRWWHSGSPIV